MKQYSLLELCDCIDDALSMELDSSYWVRAEIASLSDRGHCYMELVEKAKNNSIAAKVRATCWSNIYSLLNAYFSHETGQKLGVGMQVLLQVEVGFHAVYGLSLNIIGIDPTFTLGDMARQRQQTIQRLQDDGVMDLQRSLIMPSLPRRIAVISAADAAGYGDFCHQLENNSGGFYFRTQLFPALMQGEQSSNSIIAALEHIATAIDDYDAVVIVRGGGASTDLRNFDDYSLAFHCANFPLPIIAGIGHTRDVSVVDMVVHRSVKTPTAAAEWFINIVQMQWDKLEGLSMRLERVAQMAIHKQRSRLELLEKTIALHSPERIYRKGYSLTMVNGKVIKSIQDIRLGDELQTYMADGMITSTVQDKL